MAFDGWVSRRVIHAYEGVDLDRVWHIAQEDLPQVKDAIENILPSLDELEKQLAEDDEEAKK